MIAMEYVIILLEDIIAQLALMAVFEPTERNYVTTAKQHSLILGESYPTYPHLIYKNAIILLVKSRMILLWNS